MESIVEDMRLEVARALDRETETENHPLIVYELTQNQLAGIRAQARVQDEENEARRCTEALEDQDTQLAEELAGVSFRLWSKSAAPK